MDWKEIECLALGFSLSMIEFNLHIVLEKSDANISESEIRFIKNDFSLLEGLDHKNRA